MYGYRRGIWRQAVDVGNPLPVVGRVQIASDIDAAGFRNTFSLAHWFAQARLKLNGYEVECE